MNYIKIEQDNNEEGILNTDHIVGIGKSKNKDGDNVFSVMTTSSKNKMRFLGVKRVTLVDRDGSHILYNNANKIDKLG